MDNTQGADGAKNVCGCKCHKGKGLKGILVILIGLTFLLADVGVLSPMAAGVVWPILLILIGIKMMAHMCKCCSKAGM